VQEYHAIRPHAQPSVKPATRVLASGHDRDMRTRILWVLSGFVLLIAAAFAVKQYNDTYAHPVSPQINVTPANLGLTPRATASHTRQHHHIITLRLRAVAPVWVRVTADGRRVYQGIMRPGKVTSRWTAHRTMYILTYDGMHLKAVYNGRQMGVMATRPGLMVDQATPNALTQVS
jgi:hypothetical protein